MTFEDAGRGDLRWTRGSIALLAAGLTHGVVILLQILLLGGMGLYSVAQGGTDTLGVLAVWGVCLLLPALLSAGAALLLLVAARQQRDRGATPLVYVALVLGVFLPAGRMGLALLACSVLEVPLHLLPAIVSLAAALLVAGDRPVRE